jgi:hypothetical protein
MSSPVVLRATWSATFATMRALSGIVTGALVFLAACSSSSAGANPDGPVDTKFMGTANIACEAVLGAIAPTPFPSGVNPTDPPASALPAVGSYLDNLSINHKGTEFLVKLGNPSSGRASWRRFVSAVRSEQSAVGRQVAAAKSSDRAAYLATVHDISNIATEIDAAAKTAGFAADSFCVQLFG